MEILKGLTQKEAERRQRAYGLNALATKGRFATLKALFDSFLNPLTLLLLGASLLSAFLGDVTDCIIIFSIVLVSGAITYFQHFKAENAAERLKKKVLLTASVIRDGVEKEIPFSHVTIGDIVKLHVGDLIPADMQIFDAKELSVDQSSLTGESFPVDKTPLPLNKTIHTISQEHLAYAGTHVVTGEATGIIVAIGKSSELGKLSKQIVQSKPQTDFDKGIKNFSVLVLKLVLFLTIFVFAANVLLHHGLLESFLFAIALAVGLTPELMPVIITIALSSGAIKMERKEVIVKYLPSIQNLGSMDVLCTDKTGTLTENAITLASYEDAKGEKEEMLLTYAKLNSHFQSGFKNPLDTSLLDYTKSITIDLYKKIDEIPFDFERKKVSVVIQDKKTFLLITKGAPQGILGSAMYYAHSSKKIAITPQKRALLEKRLQQLNEKGLRVIAIATKEIAKKSEYIPADENDMVFQGFLLFSDPVKATVKSTIAQLEKSGVTIKILTGDNETVTKKTCIDAGISVENILVGKDIDSLTLPQLQEKARHTTVFANLNPEQKARIITALKTSGHVVGYLGDGINDAPPLKASDIGISVHNGSDIAKDVADIILMRKSLSVLNEGVIEGRKTYANTFKYIFMSLSSNFGNMITVAIASVFLPFLPLLPVQIILLDFLYDISQIGVPYDHVDDRALIAPHKWDLGFLQRFTFLFGPISSLFDILTFVILLFVVHASVAVFRTGWFVESFATQTLIIFAIRTHVVPFFRSRPSSTLLLSALVTLCIGICLVFTPLAHYFSFTKLPGLFFILLACEVIGYFTFVEFGKFIFYRTITQ